MELARTAATLAAAFALAACATSSGDPTPIPIGDDGAPLGRLGDAVVPQRYRLELTVDPAQPAFSAEVEIDIVLTAPTQRIRLRGDQLAVSQAAAILPDGRAVAGEFRQDNDTGSATLTLAEEVPAGPATLRLAWTAPFNAANYALFRQERDGRWYAATQFQPTGARMVFPSFDEPGFKTPFEITVTARADDVVIANAPEIAREELADGLARHVFAPTPPLPTYLIALAVGPYDVVEGPALAPNAVRTAPIPLRGVAVKDLGDRLDYALNDTGAYLAWLEDYFAIPYPFAKLDLIAMPSSFGGAMENAAAITYDESLILLDESAPLARRRVHAYVHAHELAHMWFGDLVTPAWWDDIWLNEAFASWLMYKAAIAVWPEGQFDRALQTDALAAMAEDSLAAARKIREPVLRDAEIADSFDAVTYDKGAGVLAMFEAWLGEGAFREGVRLFMTRFAGGTADSDDFIAAIADGSGDRTIGPALASFLDQPGVPLLEAALDCPARGAPRVRLRQSRYAPLGSAIDPDGQLWRIPVCIAHLDAAGGRGRSCALMTRRAQTLRLDAPSCPTAVHPNADGRGYLRFAFDDAGWAALASEVDNLSPAEALALVDSLDAAFRAGAASADAYVAGLSALAQRPEWDVVAEAADRLEDATEILDADQLAAARPGLAAIFANRYARLVGAEPFGGADPGDLLLRARLARFLAIVAEDEGVRGPMAAAAAERIGVRPVPDWSRTPIDLRETVMSVGAQELGGRFFDLVLGEALATPDPALRRDSFGALARVEDAALAARLRQALLEGRFRGSEAVGVVARQLARPATREATWDWIEANGEAVIAMAPETFRSQIISSLGGSFCDLASAAAFAAFIADHAEALPGHERSLAQTEERIALCDALRDASAADLAAALARSVAPDPLLASP